MMIEMADHPRGDPLIRGQSADGQAGPLDDDDDARSVEERLMISPISSIGSIGAENRVAGAAGVGAAADADFGQVLADVAASTVNTLRAGEAAAISGISGNAPVQSVVQAVMSAEQALQTAIAVRDKLVSAYQEVSRMAI